MCIFYIHIINKKYFYFFVDIKNIFRYYIYIEKLTSLKKKGSMKYVKNYPNLTIDENKKIDTFLEQFSAVDVSKFQDLKEGEKYTILRIEWTKGKYNKQFLEIYPSQKYVKSTESFQVFENRKFGKNNYLFLVKEA